MKQTKFLFGLLVVLFFTTQVLCNKFYVASDFTPTEKIVAAHPFQLLWLSSQDYTSMIQHVKSNVEDSGDIAFDATTTDRFTIENGARWNFFRDMMHIGFTCAASQCTPNYLGLGRLLPLRKQFVKDQSLNLSKYKEEQDMGGNIVVSLPIGGLSKSVAVIQTGMNQATLNVMANEKVMVTFPPTMYRTPGHSDEIVSFVPVNVGKNGVAITQQALLYTSALKGYQLMHCMELHKTVEAAIECADGKDAPQKFGKVEIAYNTEAGDMAEPKNHIAKSDLVQDYVSPVAAWEKRVVHTMELDKNDKVFYSPPNLIKRELYLFSKQEFEDAMNANVDSIQKAIDTITATIAIPVIPSGDGWTNPDSINGLYLNKKDKYHLILPQPFGPVLDGKWLFEEYIKYKLAQIGILHVDFVNTLFVFHRNGGQLHCGTNQVLPQGLSEPFDTTPEWLVVKGQPVLVQQSSARSRSSSPNRARANSPVRSLSPLRRSSSPTISNVRTNSPTRRSTSPPAVRANSPAREVPRARPQQRPDPLHQHRRQQTSRMQEQQQQRRQQQQRLQHQLNQVPRNRPQNRNNNRK